MAVCVASDVCHGAWGMTALGDSLNKFLIILSRVVSDSDFGEIVGKLGLCEHALVLVIELHVKQLAREALLGDADPLHEVGGDVGR